MSEKWYKSTTTRGKSFRKTSLQLRMALKKDRTRQIWKNAKRLPDICKKYTADVGSLLAFFHFCLVSILFQAYPQLKWTFIETILPSLCSSSEFPNHLPNTRRTRLLCWRWTLMVRGTNAFCVSAECFNAGHKRVENACSNFSPTVVTLEHSGHYD